MIAQEQPIADKQKQTAPVRPQIRVWALAGELGLLIAVPLVILILIGIRLDRWAGTTPLFIIVSLLTSFIVSTIAIARKIRRVQMKG